jgi:hypothetical protein
MRSRLQEDALMRAMFKLTFMPEGPLQNRLQSRLEAMQGVRAAVLEAQDRTAYVDFEPPFATNAAIENVIRSCGVGVESASTEPGELPEATPQGRAIPTEDISPGAAVARMMEEADVEPGTPKGSLMPESGEATRAAFPGHSL